MINNIKVILILIIFLNSCSTVAFDYSYFGYFKNSFLNSDATIDETPYKDSKFSYILVKHNKKEAIFVLSSIENNIYTWIGRDLSKIRTFNGIIIEISGIFDIEAYIKDLKNFNFDKNLNIIRYSFKESNLYFHEFYFLTKDIKSNNGCIDVQYTRESPMIGFRSLENICYDESGYPLSSKQQIIKDIEPFELEFRYKF